MGGCSDLYQMISFISFDKLVASERKRKSILNFLYSRTIGKDALMVLCLRFCIKGFLFT